MVAVGNHPVDEQQLRTACLVRLSCSEVVCRGVLKSQHAHQCISFVKLKAVKVFPQCCSPLYLPDLLTACTYVHFPSEMELIVQIAILASIVPW